MLVCEHLEATFGSNLGLVSRLHYSKDGIVYLDLKVCFLNSVLKLRYLVDVALLRTAHFNCLTKTCVFKIAL